MEPDDVGEEDGGQHAVGLGHLPGAGQEFLDLVDDLIAVQKRHVVIAGQFDQPRVGNAFGEVASLFDEREAIPGPVDDERRHTD